METPYNDKNNNRIHAGDTVRFKFYGQHYFTDVVKAYKNDFSPFANKPIEIGFGNMSAGECEIISNG